MTNGKVPVTTFFQSARDISNLPVTISKMPVIFLVLSVTIFEKVPVTKSKVPVTKLKKKWVKDNFGCHGGKKYTGWHC